MTIKCVSVVFVLPVIYFDILVGLWVIHEPHQLQVEDWWKGEKLDSFLCFLQHKTNTPFTSVP